MFTFQEMDEKHSEVLQRCSDYLIKNMIPQRIMDKLYSVKILTNDDVMRLKNQATDNDRNRLLVVEMLPKAGPEAFSSLVKALEDSEQQYVAKYLREQLNKGTPTRYNNKSELTLR